MTRISEAIEIQRSILAWLNTRSGNVYDIKFQELPENQNGMCMASMPSTKIIDEDILGNYTAQYSFQLVYRSYPSDSNENLSAEEELDSIGEWVDDQDQSDYPSLSGNCIITDIKRSSTTALISKTESGICDYSCQFNATYKKFN